LEQPEAQLGIPLLAATQWEMVEETAELIKPARDELIRQTAQGKVLHNDDTSMRVLKLKRKDGDPRAGVFTRGIVSMNDGRSIALFFTGAQHAGENMADVLKSRAAELPAPIQMCDALSVICQDCLAASRSCLLTVDASGPCLVVRAVRHIVGRNYFETARIRVLAGRSFRFEDEAEGANSIILSRAAAHELLGDEEPVGRMVEIHGAIGNAPKVLPAGLITAQ
jgi:hypothetical protein